MPTKFDQWFNSALAVAWMAICMGCAAWILQLVF
jgi:hypothetical protein